MRTIHDPAMTTISAVLTTVPPSVAVEIADALYQSADPSLRCWAVDESRRLRDEIDAQLRADRAEQERRRDVGRRNIANLRAMVQTDEQ